MAVFDPIKTATAKVRNNPIGGVVGAVAGFYAAKKFMPGSSMWVKAAFVVGGVFAGAYGQAMISAKSGSNKSAEQAK